jgi:chromosome segregation and condensation protein ScpB
VFPADAPRQAAVRRDRKPAVAAVESKPRVAREPLSAEALAERTRKRRERHRARKLAALSELLNDLGLELKERAS